MIHPSRLWRTNDDQTDSFSAPTNINLRLHNFDCGLTAIPWLSPRLKLDKYAKVNVFVAVASILGFIQGCSISYFKGTSHIWGQHYNFLEGTIDYLIYLGDIFIGLSALVIGYWGNKIHRASWIGGLTILHSIAGLLLIVPEIFNPIVDTKTVTLLNEAQLCTPARNHSDIFQSVDEGKSYIAIVMFTCYQLFNSFSSISLITHAVTYIDDHVENKSSAGHISLLLAIYEFGKHAGMYLSWFPIFAESDKIFVSAMWLILVILLFLIGSIIAMFPKMLPSKILREGVQSILNITDEIEEEYTKTNFIPTIIRLFSNKILLVNILSATFMNIAITNFIIRQNDFFRSRFYVSVGKDFSRYQDPTQAQLMTNLMLQPMTGLAIISTGLVIATFKPKAKHLALWNVFTYIIAASLFTSFAFLVCEDSIHSDHGSAITYCNAKCNCPFATFSPVCVDNKTFFSPCHAGCTDKNITISQETIYANCKCGGNIYDNQVFEGKDGSCNNSKCSYIWGLAQASGIFGGALLATALVTQIIINLRCVQEKDKALTLSLHLMFTKILPFIPFKMIYDIISESMCQSRDKNNTCNFYKQQFGMFLSLITVIVMLIATGLAVWLISLVDNLNLHDDRKMRSDRLRELSTMNNTTENSVNGDLESDMNESENDRHYFESNRQSESSHSLPVKQNPSNDDEDVDTSEDDAPKKDDLIRKDGGDISDDDIDLALKQIDEEENRSLLETPL